MADGRRDDKKPGHTLADHVLGQDFVHEHDGDADHDHDHFEFDADGPLEDNPIWIQDHVTLVTVGIDIGSSGTQVIFSRINLRRYGEDLTSRYYVVVARDPVPVAGGADALCRATSASTTPRSARIIDEAYAAAGVEARATSTPAWSSSPARRCGARTPRRSPACWPSSAAISSPPPPGTTWSRCWPPTARAPSKVSYDAGQAHPQHRHRRRHHQARASSRTAT